MRGKRESRNSCSEFLELLRPVRKKWLAPEARFQISISYQTGVQPTERTVEVSDAFGLGLDVTREFIIYDDLTLEIGPRDIVYITGDSGSGKSVLLRWLEQALKPDTVNITDVKPDPEKPLVDTLGKTTGEALKLLTAAGLGDAYLFLRRYPELSDGQKYRYKIARMMESGAQYWFFDEFCSLLDRDTAKIVAFNVQKLARRLGKSVIAATTHRDLFDDLAPTVHVHKRFGREVKVRYYPGNKAEECSLVREMRVEEGGIEDWRRLAGFHYRSHRIAAPRKIFCLRRGDELCGVIVYCYPPVACFGRRKVLPKMGMKELNEKLSIISRVVVHPKYRGIGLGAKLVKETLPKAGTPYVEMVAVMARYNPFAEKAGMQRIAEQPPAKQALAIAETLRQLGFNTQLLGSISYVMRRLKTLKPEQLQLLREAFIQNKLPRIMKYLSSHKPYAETNLYAEKIRRANVEKLATLVRVCGLLLQTKVYLFWSCKGKGEN